MANKIFPAGTGVTTRTAAELVASDMYLMGTSDAATASAVAYDTKFSTARVAIAGLLAGYDTVKIEYKNTTTITVKAGGQYSANGILYTVASDFDLATNTDLTTDDTLTADTWYYIVTNGTTYKLSDATTCSDVSNGVALGAGISIYNDSGTLKIRPFDMRGRWYRYRNVILVYGGAITTSNTLLSLGSYLPSYAFLADFLYGHTGSGVTIHVLYFSFADRSDTIHAAIGTFPDGIITRLKFVTPVQQSIYIRALYGLINVVLYLQGFQLC